MGENLLFLLQIVSKLCYLRHRQAKFWCCFDILLVRCQFTAHQDILEKHILAQHVTGLYNRCALHLHCLWHLFLISVQDRTWKQSRGGCKVERGEEEQVPHQGCGGGEDGKAKGAQGEGGGR